MSDAVSPLAPKRFPKLPAVGGVRVSGTEANLRYSGRPDLMLAEFPDGAAVAGVFTKSLTAGAPVDWCRSILPRGMARGVLVNAGNANVFNGESGDQVVRTAATEVAARLGCAAEDIYLASTGVIGEPLDAGAIVSALDAAKAALSPDAWPDAAQAIMTTDTFAKGCTRTVHIDGAPVQIVGFAKGSGMIAPDMATMLSFIFTDAAISSDVLQKLLNKAVDKSYNAITVDSDTSTSDTVLLFATGAAGHGPITDVKDKRLNGFKRALGALTKDLALQVVRDGEGAQKLIEISVSGAASSRAAKKIALSIANSPLVKTAIAGEDANWGRIVMAVGKAGEKADRDSLSIDIGGHAIARNGRGIEGYDETPVAAYMKGQEIEVSVDVGVGRGKSTVWTCDLTHGYIDINADYRS